MTFRRRRGNTFEFKLANKKYLGKPLWLTFDSEEEGDAWCNEVKRHLSVGIVLPQLQEVLDQRNERKPPQITLGKLIRDYLDANNVTQDDDDILNRIITLDKLGDTPLDKITYDWSETWITSMKRKLERAPGTIRKYVGALRRCLDWGVKRNDQPIAANPLWMLKKGYSQYTKKDEEFVERREDQKRDRRLSEDGEEEKRIRSVIAGEYEPRSHKEHLKFDDDREEVILMFECALETAMRMREIYTLDRYQIDLNKRTIFLENTKNGDDRQVPMTSIIFRAFEEYFASHQLKPKDAVFPWVRQHGGNLKDTTNKLSKRWAAIFDHAECEDLDFHDLRHESTSRFYERTTLTDLEISKITGHRDLRSLARYANLRGSKLAKDLW